MYQETIIILNTHINGKVFKQINQNSLIICADGGANRLYDLDKTVVPNYIIGDLDSLRLEVREYYSQRGSTVIQDDDQETSDLEKVLMFVEKKLNASHIIILGGLQERFDQTINQLHSLMKFQFKGQLISDYSVLRYYGPGTHQFQFQELEQKKGISLFPGGGQARITTSGLRWNVSQDNPLIMGKFISTSNEALSEQLNLESLDDFFLVTQLKDEFI